MKTAISIPDPIFEAADNLARQLGLSRSELYSTAVAAFVEQHRDDQITEQLNAVYSEQDSALDEVAVKLQVLSLSQEEW